MSIYIQNILSIEYIKIYVIVVFLGTWCLNIYWDSHDLYANGVYVVHICCPPIAGPP